METRDNKIVPIKNCQRCGISFHKPYKYSKTQWNNTLFCSKKCGGVVGGVKRRGKPSWNKGLSSWAKGKKFTDEHRKNISLGSVGHKFTIEQRKKLSLSRKGRKNPNRAGEKSNFWKGGVTPINILIRASLEYRLWRESVFKRDKYTCIWCGQVGGKLNADHIKPFSQYPELRFAIDNGRTLCECCHRKTDTWGGGSKKKLLN
jgi:hypothetical protein